MNRREFLLGAGALTQLKGQPAGARPNILVIMADDLAAWMCGCYGNKEIRTPNIDSLARSGIRFANGYVATPICSASRATFFTGRLPRQHGIQDFLTDNPVENPPQGQKAPPPSFDKEINALEETDVFGRKCLAARRLLERGVRFVQIWSGNDNGFPRLNWDSHEDVKRDHGPLALGMARGTAALIQDLKRVGLLDDTIAKMNVMAERAEGGEAYDQQIGEGNAEGNAVVQAAIDGLIAQTRGIERAVALLELDDVTIEDSDSLSNPDAVFE